MTGWGLIVLVLCVLPFWLFHRVKHDAEMKRRNEAFGDSDITDSHPSYRPKRRP